MTLAAVDRLVHHAVNSGDERSELPPTLRSNPSEAAPSQRRQGRHQAEGDHHRFVRVTSQRDPCREAPVTPSSTHAATGHPNCRAIPGAVHQSRSAASEQPLWQLMCLPHLCPQPSLHAGPHPTRETRCPHRTLTYVPALAFPLHVRKARPAESPFSFPLSASCMSRTDQPEIDELAQAVRGTSVQIGTNPGAQLAA